MLNSQNLIPWYIFGQSSSMADQFQSYYFQPPNSALRLYYSLQLGYHFNSITQTLLGQLKQESFIEMATHHVICLMLFSMNVLTNRLLPTVALTLCCSVTDVVMTLTRVFIDTEYNKIGGVIAVLFLMPSWFYFRLVAYPYNLY